MFKDDLHKTLTPLFRLNLCVFMFLVFIPAEVRGNSCAELGFSSVTEVIPSAEKPVTFNKVDPLLQLKFAETLTEVAAIQLKHPKDQCYFSCATFAFSAYLDQLTPPEFSDSISGAFLTAKSYELKFLDFIVGNGPVVSPGTAIPTIDMVLEVFGILTESQYPSNSRVNTRDLVKNLNLLATEYHTKLSQLARPEDKDKLTTSALTAASGLIQTYFGKYPEEIFDNGVRTSAHQQKERILRARSHYPVPKKLIRTYIDFSNAATFLLKNRVPVVLSYDSVSGHGADGVFDVSENSVSGTNHLVLLLGVYTDPHNSIYYKVQNTHAGAEILYLSSRYLANRINFARFAVPYTLAHQFVETIR